jgi:hypothetical protein
MGYLREKARIPRAVHGDEWPQGVWGRAPPFNLAFSFEHIYMFLLFPKWGIGMFFMSQAGRLLWVENGSHCPWTWNVDYRPACSLHCAQQT